MAEIYGTGTVSYQVKSAAENFAMGMGAIEALRQISMGSSINLSGADYAETVQHLQSLAILELAEKLDV